MPKKKEEVKEEVKEEKTVQELQQEIEELRSKNEKAESQLHPENGPGKWCECWKATMGEAAQLHADENGRFPEPAPGFETMKRADTNRQYLMRQTEEKPDGKNIVQLMNDDNTPKGVFTFHPSCNSKYTKKRTVKFREKGKSYKDFDYDEKKLHLCDKHAEFLGEG